MEKKLKQIFDFFNITSEELEGFLVNDLGVKNLEEFKINPKVVDRLVEFFNIRKEGWKFVKRNFRRYKRKCK